MTPDHPPRALGRRKTAIAHVELVAGKTDSTVNNIPFTQYFPTVPLQQMALAPLKLVSKVEEFGIRARVHGGGIHAQADAVRLGIARALLLLDENWRKQLKQAGMLTRDPRMKERKKFGLKRARRAPQFSKR